MLIVYFLGIPRASLLLSFQTKHSKNNADYMKSGKTLLHIMIGAIFHFLLNLPLLMLLNKRHSDSLLSSCYFHITQICVRKIGWPKWQKTVVRKQRVGACSHFPKTSDMREAGKFNYEEESWSNDKTSVVGKKLWLPFKSSYIECPLLNPPFISPISNSENRKKTSQGCQ